MTASEREKKLTVAQKEASDEMKAQMEELQEKVAKSKSTRGSRHAADDEEGGSGGAGKLVGFAIILVVVFFLWAMMPTFVAMSLAWKIAANA
jgi:hypothetical protein